MIDWINQNKEWFFSGLGVTIITIVAGWLFNSSKNKSIKQIQSSGNNSSNIQVGGDYVRKGK
jgi:hypothetical protein